jgi:flagellar biosynthesis protein FlhG
MAVHTLEQTSKHSITGENLIAVASGKGGVGKTWLAITLTHALSRANCNVLLFDGDVGLANVDIQLGLMPERDLGSVLAGKSTLRQSIGKHADAGFDIIAGQSGSGGLASLPAPRLLALRDELLTLSRDYDRIVIDVGAGLDRTVRLLAAQSGTVMVMATDEPTSLTDAYAFIKVMLAERPEADLRIVVNLAESRSAGEKTYETLLTACRNFLEFEPPLAGVIRRDNRVREAIRNQTALLTRSPTCEAASDVEAIARGLLGPS